EGHYNLGVAFGAQAHLLDRQAELSARQTSPDAASHMRQDAKKKRQDAIAEFDAALRARPNYYLAEENRGLALFELGELEAAKAAFRRIFEELEPNYGRAHLDLARVLVREGNRNSAKREIEAALQVEPGIATAPYTLGIIRELRQSGAAK